MKISVFTLFLLCALLGNVSFTNARSIIARKQQDKDEILSELQSLNKVEKDDYEAVLQDLFNTLTTKQLQESEIVKLQGLFKKIGKHLKHAGKHIKHAGKHIRKHIKHAGKHIRKHIKHIGKHVGKHIKHFGKHFKKIGKGLLKRALPIAGQLGTGLLGGAGGVRPGAGGSAPGAGGCKGR